MLELIEAYSIITLSVVNEIYPWLDRRPPHIGDSEAIFVAASREIDQDDLLATHRRRQLDRLGDRVGAFERRNDALQPREQLKGRERFFVARRGVEGALVVMQHCVLGANRGVVEPGRDTVRERDLSIFVLQH